ncbi:MAG: PilZ domain-containing protein [Hyphomicrobiales bacterium]
MTSQADTMLHDDKRHKLRQSAVMQARIVMPNQRSFAPCFVREVSRTGAKLTIDDGWLIPKAFWLRIDGDPLLHYYTVVWRSAGEIGIELASGTRKRSWTGD